MGKLKLLSLSLKSVNINKWKIENVKWEIIDINKRIGDGSYF